MLGPSEVYGRVTYLAHHPLPKPKPKRNAPITSPLIASYMAYGHDLGFVCAPKVPFAIVARSSTNVYIQNKAAGIVEEGAGTWYP